MCFLAPDNSFSFFFFRAQGQRLTLLVVSRLFAIVIHVPVHRVMGVGQNGSCLVTPGSVGTSSKSQSIFLGLTYHFEF